MKYQYCCTNCKQFLNEFVKHDDIPIKCCPFCYAELYEYEINKNKNTKTKKYLSNLTYNRPRPIKLSSIITMSITLIFISILFPILLVFISDVNIFENHNSISVNTSTDIITLLGVFIPMIITILIILYYIKQER